jgi:hypothetical protein
MIGFVLAPQQEMINPPTSIIVYEALPVSSKKRDHKNYLPFNLRLLVLRIQGSKKYAPFAGYA